MNFYTPRKTVLAALGLFLFGVSAAKAAVNYVDVMVLYANQATTVSQGRDMPALAASFVAYANQTYSRSDVDIRLRIVHMAEDAITSGDQVSATALYNLATDPGVAQMRSQNGADLVVLLTRRQETDGFFYCGVGYLLEGSDGRFDRGAKYGGFSVSAVNCGNPTFVHEVGHNMGLGHSYVQGSSGGIYSWARGHGEFNNFATIMAYPQAYGSARRVQQFSSANQFKCNRLRCGVSRNRFNGADSVRNLNTVANQVAAFMPKKK